MFPKFHYNIEWRTSRRSGMLNLDGLNLNSKLFLVVGTCLLSIFITKQSLGFRNRSSRLRNLGNGKSSSITANKKMLKCRWCYSNLSHTVTVHTTQWLCQKIYICKQVELQLQLGWSMLHVSCRQLSEFFFEVYPDYSVLSTKLKNLSPVL